MEQEPSATPTPPPTHPLHIHAYPDSIAPIVLLPGDPNRARYIAETFLASPICYNENRQLLGFTGTYKGTRVTVQATGMGAPSAAIVIEELVKLGAKVFIRCGTAGIIARDVKPCDIIIAMASNPNDGTTRQYLPHVRYAPVADFSVVEALVWASRQAVPDHIHVGLIQSDDGFYTMAPEHVPRLAAMGVLAVEMETAILFALAKLRGVRAGALLVASNYIGDPEFVEPTRLRDAVNQMLDVALNAAVAIKL
ncbi:putative Purine nucleoside phosphorylase DeoD-type [Paratrimastix pyriformis]|uniref:Purine nucleoside phosphorylase DeoD-type n=1 Tax=Paratrimastix pyriformis TaxID=342808 RepID=A0ABQ8UCD8_9EUKA|nr:putative Purine nucleoside phosphorylase DeoD-type [Paratrimastix pyriformis]|eukprot:GAFH01004281.1.p1 GENE.GAFH01004281.1~~GAFH01004281.1.p1  ORF type:complete len:265 (-),score=25.23 GAFH01004281.1:13-768(-)